MTWKLIFSNSARRNLRKLPLNDRRRIDRPLDELALDPSQGDVLPLRNHPAEFRKRVGDYRVFFDVNRHERLVRSMTSCAVPPQLIDVADRRSTFEPSF